MGGIIMAKYVEKPTIKCVMTLDDVRNVGYSKEGIGDGPFATMTWERWLEAQAQVEQCLSRFVEAVQEQRAAQVLMIGLEIQEVATQMLLEAYAMSADLSLEVLPEK
jgi:hypothetical protein